MNMTFKSFSKASKLLNQRIGPIKYASLENRHHNLSIDILLDQNRDQQGCKVSSKSMRKLHGPFLRVKSPFFFFFFFSRVSLCKILFHFNHYWFKKPEISWSIINYLPHKKLNGYTISSPDWKIWHT